MPSRPSSCRTDAASLDASSTTTISTGSASRIDATASAREPAVVMAGDDDREPRHGGSSSSACGSCGLDGEEIVSSPISCTSAVIRRSSRLTRTEKCSSISSTNTSPKKNSVELGSTAPIRSVTLSSSSYQMREDQQDDRGQDPQERVLLLELPAAHELDDQPEHEQAADDREDAGLDRHQPRSPERGRSTVTRIDSIIL